MAILCTRRMVAVKGDSRSSSHQKGIKEKRNSSESGGGIRALARYWGKAQGAQGKSRKSTEGVATSTGHALRGRKREGIRS